MIRWIVVFSSLATFLICVLTPVYAETPGNEDAAAGVRAYWVDVGKTVSSVTVTSIGKPQTRQTSKGPILYWPVTATVVERAGTKQSEGVVFRLPAGVSFDRAKDGTWYFQNSADDLQKRVDDGDPPLISANAAAKTKGEKAKLAQEYYFTQHNKFTCNLHDLQVYEPHLTEGGTILYEFQLCDTQKYSFTVRHASGNKVFTFGN